MSDVADDKEVIKISSDGLLVVKHPDVRLRESKNGKKVFDKGSKSLGRPKGSLNKTTAIAKEMIGNNAEKIIKKVIQKAMNDEDKDQGAMLKLLMERIIPSSKAIDITSTSRDERSITISVEGVNVHSSILDAEVVNLIEDNDD